MRIDIVRVFSVIDYNLNKVNTTAEVAMILNVCPESLRKVFKREKNISLRESLFTRKVVLMQELILMDPDMASKQVCCEAGLREDSGARIFKKYTGMTMKEFSEKMKCPRMRKDFLRKRNQKLIAEEKTIMPE